jgi:hypothetical protein
MICPVRPTIQPKYEESTDPLKPGGPFIALKKENAASQREAAFENTLCLLAVCDSQKPRGSLCSPGTEPHVLKTAKNDSGFAFLASAKVRRCVAGLLLNLVTAAVAATASAAAIVVAAEDGVAQVLDRREQVAQQVVIVATA